MKLTKYIFLGTLILAASLFSMEKFPEVGYTSLNEHVSSYASCACESEEINTLRNEKDEFEKKLKLSRLDSFFKKKFPTRCTFSFKDMQNDPTNFLRYAYTTTPEDLEERRREKANNLVHVARFTHNFFLLQFPGQANCVLNALCAQAKIDGYSGLGAIIIAKKLSREDKKRIS